MPSQTVGVVTGRVFRKAKGVGARDFQQRICSEVVVAVMYARKYHLCKVSSEVVACVNMSSVVPAVAKYSVRRR